ncbi:ABC transporter ATP-binding protein [bacterium]|nr:ABC transporter ATP-binding protein [bacterium]
MRYHSYHHETEMGKVYDSRLIKRLFHYAKPYKKFIVLAIFILLLTAGGDIFLPYLSKMGIDNYIVFNKKQLNFEGKSSLKQEIIDKYSSKIITTDDGLIFIDIEDMDMSDSKKLEADSVFSNEKYYIINTDDLSSETVAEVEKVIDDNREKFHSSGKYHVISLEDLSKLKTSETGVIRQSDLRGVLIIGLVYLGILLLNFVLGFAHIYITTYTGQKVMYDIRVKLFEHVEHLSLAFFDKNPIGRLVTRVTNDIEVLNEMFTAVLINIFKDVFILVGIVVIMLIMNWQLALVCFAILPLIVVVTIYFKIKVRDAFRTVRIKIARINATLAEYINGIRIIKIFARELKNLKHFKLINQEHYEANMRQLLIHAIFSPLTHIISSLGMALIIWYGGGKVIQNMLTLGSLVAFLQLIEMFFRPIRDISEKYHLMQSSMASSERIFDLMDQKMKIENPPQSIVLKNIKGSIKFENVWFSYEDDEYVLRDVSFNIEPGERIALVGATGSGKTTIINLISRFYDIQKGKIYIDGHDIKDIDKFSLRTHIGVVLQDVFLFATDIEKNITLNKDDLSSDQIKEIAEFVNAHHFIEKLPNKYSEQVKERGVTLSMGQRQLLAFARALAYDPKILVLDEATSNIDTETEQLIQKALERLLENRTSIIIAHRLSTIQKANKIMVIHKGKIREIGTHQELLAEKGLYYNLYLLQYKDQIQNMKAV